MVPLPNLRAFWLNGNPVVDTCSNFSMIGSTMPKLEILNSVLTNKAGEWSMLFYAKDQTGATSLETVDRLDLSSKGILNMPSADVFGRMTNLKTLDINGHPEFFMTPLEKYNMENDALEGLGSKEGVTFTETLITIDDVLANLTSVETLKCGFKLEEYLCNERVAKGYLPNLKLLNNIDVSVTEIAERNKTRDALEIIEKLPLIANVYILGQETIWYLNDEVGSIIGHSDTPNVKVRSFINSPSNSMNDENRIEVSVMWPVIDIGKNHGFLKDYLQGWTEQRGFRSTRLHSFYDVPTEYFGKQLEILRKAMPSLDIEEMHQAVQEDSPLKTSIVNDTNEAIKVFTDVPDAMETLQDPRF